MPAFLFFSLFGVPSQRLLQLPGLLFLLLICGGVAESVEDEGLPPQPQAPILTNRPIIAIFAHPFPNFTQAPLSLECTGEEQKAQSCEYIAASYPKWIEAAGGRAIPVPYNASKAVIDEVFNSVNGLLLPGGGAKLSPAVTYFLEKAVAANKAKDYFPVWGTCLGFEWLIQAFAQDENALQNGFDSENISLALNLTAAGEESHLFSGLPGPVREALQTEPITMNNHGQGVEPTQLRGNEKLDAFFEILATNKDRKGREFVSVIEARGGMPVYGVQFHPEKSEFEFGEFPDGRPFEGISHTENAVLAAQSFANFFVGEARKSSHAFPDPASEQRALFYNYKMTPCTQSPCAFVQFYFFKNFTAFGTGQEALIGAKIDLTPFPSSSSVYV